MRRTMRRTATHLLLSISFCGLLVSSFAAAERTGRICHGMELAPQYVDVAVARWESFTGETARKEQG